MKPQRLPNIINNISNKTVRRAIFKVFHPQSKNIMQKDWDNLIILDACRFDIFSDVNFLQGDLDYIMSNSSTSNSFMRKNICNKNFHDTVYVTANPFAPMAANTFFKIETTFSDKKKINSGRIVTTRTSDGRILKNNHINNIHPENITQKSIRLSNEYPNKKIVAHYMQPHRPYLGEEAKSLREKVRKQHNIEFSHWSDADESGDDKIDDLMDAAVCGYISREELVDVYKDNLKIVLEYVEKLIPELGGKTIVTSDHGELLGERKLGKRHYTHSEGVLLQELRKVPFLTIENGKRRSISADHPDKKNNIDDSSVEKQLELLGYK